MSPSLSAQPTVRHFVKTDDDASWHYAHNVRLSVFVKEQKVPVENEVDELDDVAHHWIVFPPRPADEESDAVGTVRLYMEKDNVAHLGRLATLKSARGRGYGKMLCRAAETYARESLQARKIVLHAQTDKREFYESIGYVVDDEEVFYEEGIAHVHMSKH